MYFLINYLTKKIAVSEERYVFIFYNRLYSIVFSKAFFDYSLLAN